MRIGFLPIVDGQSGGSYQYSLSMLQALQRLDGHGSGDTFVLLTSPADIEKIRSVNGKEWRVVPVGGTARGRGSVLDAGRRIAGEGPHREAWRWLRRKLRGGRTYDNRRPRLGVAASGAEAAHRLRRRGIELVIYPYPRTLCFEVGIPYVVAIHDVEHRLQPELPEFASGGRWERREQLFRNSIRFATLVLVDSEVGKEQVMYFYSPYGLAEERVKVLPFCPAPYLDGNVSREATARVKKKYGLPDRYVFYPAQFWPHKNHARIVQALEHLRGTEGVRIPAVFCGSHSGAIREENFRLVMNMAEHAGVADQIHYLGYVPDVDMSALYAGAVMLTMPTLFGPTNIPVLEAWALGCPVLTSDIRGVREQMADAALLVDARSVSSVGEGILQLWRSEERQRDLVERGRRRLTAYSSEDYEHRLSEIVEEAKARAHSEGSRIGRP